MRVVTPPAPDGGMTTNMNRPGASKFIALERALEIVESVRGVVWMIRRRDIDLARQLLRSAASIAANVGEGNRRQGRDRLHFFRIAAGSAEETRVHLRIAVAWGWVATKDIAASMDLIDQELAILWRLTH
jgi:four helix bundle protein